MSDTPEWLVPGATVAVVTEAQHGTHGHVIYLCVDRILKRDVVLVDGQRFNKERLSRSNGTWSPTTDLLHPDDPKVLRVEEANARRQASQAVQRNVDRVEKAARAYRDAYTTEDRVAAVEAARSALLTLNTAINRMETAA